MDKPRTLFHKPKSYKGRALVIQELFGDEHCMLYVIATWWDISNSLHPKPLDLPSYAERLTQKAWLQDFDRLLLTVPNI